MSITLKDAVDFLLSNGYAFRHGGKIKFHKKAYDELTYPVKAAVEFPKLYIQFIFDAKIPPRAEDSRGGYYQLNQYSEPAMKAFRKIMESGVSYEDLVASTKLYYQSGVKLKVKVSRYIEEGLWRSDYDAYIASKEAGTISQHEKEQKSDGTTTSWVVG